MFKAHYSLLLVAILSIFALSSCNKALAEGSEQGSLQINLGIQGYVSIEKLGSINDNK